MESPVATFTQVGKRRAKWSSWATAYAFLLPALILFVFFELFSLIYNIYIGFHSWKGFGAPTFVGLDNYADLFSDKLFWGALGHNFIFMIVALFIMTILGLFLALVLDSGMPGAGVFRGLLFLPVIIPTVVVGLVWTRIYSTQGGLLNQFLEVVGLASWQQDWLGNPQTALPAVLVVWVWRHLGYGVVMFSAGLLGIPDDLKDAAALDGASAWQTVWQIIVPLLRPVILIIAILFAIFAFKVFTLVFIMTDGGPYNATEVLNTYMYDRVFKFFELGLGSSITNLVILILLVFAAVRSRFKADFEF
jgi:raffinose/stachyose/melibiose transport system permease protein